MTLTTENLLNLEPLHTPTLTPPNSTTSIASDLLTPKSDTSTTYNIPITISSLPNELLVVIFSFIHDDIVHGTKHLITASQVCRLWHSNILAILWSRVEVRRQYKWEMIRKGLITKYGHFVGEITFYSVLFDAQDKQQLIDKCQNLKGLSLVKCRGLDKEFLEEWTRVNSMTLRTFTIWGPGVYESLATEVTNYLLLPMLKHANRLEELHILCSAVTDEFLSDIAFHTTTWPHLTLLDLTECGKITASGVAELFTCPQQFPKLAQLQLQYNEDNYLDVDFFEFLAVSFPQYQFHIVVTDWYLETTQAGTCVMISDDLRELKDKRDNVRLETRIGGRSLW